MAKYRKNLKNDQQVKVKPQVVEIPQNLTIEYITKFLKFYVENQLTKINNYFEKPIFIDYKIIENKIYFTIKQDFLKFIASKMMLYTFTSKFKNAIFGISSLYKGTINLQGLGFSVNITKLLTGKYNLFFRFGFKDKYNYVMPDDINIDNVETAKTKVLLSCTSIETLKKVQIQIRNLRKPKAFKLQGIYLNDIFPKVKKFVK